MYNFEDIMSKLDDIEAKVDTLIEQKEFTPVYSYSNYTTHYNKIGDETRRAEVLQRGDGVWCVEKFINDERMEIMPLPGKSEHYAEDAAENFVTLN